MRLSYYLLLLVTLVTCTTQSESENNRPALATSPAPNPPRATTSDTSSVFLFNVPSLLGKNIDEIERQLGKTTVKDSPNLNDEELERTYSKGGYNLVITYNKSTRHVEGCLILAASGKTKDCGKLLAVGNLKPGSQVYAVDSLNRDNGGYFLGIAITTKE